jgi:nicotinamide phosphoribosyltransferase
MLLGDFSMRGQQSAESAIKSSAAWCLSFYNTATVPAIMWLEDNYNCDSGKDEVAYGAVSTEHSVMCSNYAVDGDEITHIKRLLTEIYPEISFSMVSDSYDYWNLVTKILPRCKKEIMEHKGCLAIRGDSGDPVEVIAGKRFYPIDGALLEENDEDKIGDWFNDWAFDCGIEYSDIYYFQDANGKVYSADVDIDYSYECGYYTDTEYRYIDSLRVEWKEISPTAEIMGTVWALWQEFGGTLNSKGYKVLNPHVKAIYGDSITPQRCEEIYKRLMMQGFAISNVSLGVGSFSMMCLENIDSEGKISYSPYTRDTFGIAVKATYAEDKDGKPIMIYKQPKALSWKKSQKGCCIVAEDGESYTDEHTLEETANHKCKNLLIPVFANGQLIRQYTLDEVRRNMYPETTEDWCDERYYW